MDYLYILKNNYDSVINISSKHFSDEELNDFKMYRFCVMTLTRVVYNFLPIIFKSDAYLFGSDNEKGSLIVSCDSITSDNLTLDNIYNNILLSYEENYHLAYNVLELYNFGFFKGVYLDENENRFCKIAGYWFLRKQSRT